MNLRVDGLALQEDWKRAMKIPGTSSLSSILYCVRQPGFHAVTIYRLGHWLKTRVILKMLLGPLYLLLHRRMKARWGIEVQTGAQIGGGFLIHHYGGIFIGSGVTIGRNCSITHDITIGISGRGDKKGTPVIGDNVYIAPGAKLIGKITIGNNVTIGPNSVVMRNVPDDAMVVVSDPKIVRFSRPAQVERELNDFA